MNPHFFTAPFYFAFIWFRVQGSRFRALVAASPPFFRRCYSRIAAFPTRGRLCVGDTAFLIQPPPLRGTSFHRKEGASTRAPSLGRGCRAQRGGVGFLFCGEAASSLPSPRGEGKEEADGALAAGKCARECVSSRRFTAAPERLFL